MEQARQLAAFLRAEVDDGLRAVVYYSTESELFQDSGTYELVYLRSEDERPTAKSEVETVMEATGIESLGRTIRTQHESHDTLNFVVKNFETVTEVFFFLDEDEGVALSLEPSVFSSTNPLINSCLDVLNLEASSHERDVNERY